jgi:hypothetical protein
MGAVFRWAAMLRLPHYFLSQPADCASFATHKRHLALFAMANLLSRRVADAV